MARTSATWAGRHTAGLPKAAAAAAAATDTTTSSESGAAAAAAATTTAKAAAAAAAAAATTKQPKTVLEKIVYSIRQQPEGKTSKGVSRQTIIKYLKSELNYDNANAIKRTLKQAVEKGQLIQNGQSFRVKGDPVENKEGDGPKVQITDLKPTKKKTKGAADGSDDEDDGGGDDDTDGLVAQIGDSVTVKYSGKLDDGHEFDKASNFTFVLGAGDVIKGWDQGIQGMKIGGRRKLVVPGKLGYGKRGCAPDIPGNATLHFVVTLKQIDRPEA